jgi:hypothetical protein
MKPIKHDMVQTHCQGGWKIYGSRRKKIHDFQMQFNNCIILTIIIIIIIIPSLIVKMRKHGCKWWIVVCSHKLDG